MLRANAALLATVHHCRKPITSSVHSCISYYHNNRKFLVYDSLPIYIISFYIMYACVILYFAGNLLDCYQHYCIPAGYWQGLLLIVVTLWLTTITHTNITYPIQHTPYLAGLTDNITYPYPHNNSSTQQVDRSLNMNNNIHHRCHQQGATIRGNRPHTRKVCTQQ